MSEPPASPPTRKRRKLSTWGCLMLIALVVFVFGGIIFTAVWITHRNAKLRLAQTIADIKASGAPYDVESLTEYRAVPAGKRDLSERYAAILAKVKSEYPVPSPYEHLPVVGDRDTPAPDEAWDDIELADDYLAERPWLAELDELAEIDGAANLPWPKFENVPDISLLPPATRGLQLRFAVQLHRKNRPAALLTLRSLARLNRLTESDPFVIPQLVRVAVDGMAFAMVRDFLRNGQATKEELATLRALFSANYQNMLVPTLVAERGYSCIASRRTTLDDAQSFLDLSDNPRPKRMAWMGSVADVAPGEVADALEISAKVIEAAKAPKFHDAFAAARAVEAPHVKALADKRMSILWNSSALDSTVRSNLAWVSVLMAAESRRRALRAMLDLEDRLTDLPESARTTAIAGDFLRERLAQDDYSDPFDGNPLRYKVEPAAVTIYSIGQNLRDDGGDVERPLKDAGLRFQRPLIDSGAATAQ